MVRDDGETGRADAMADAAESATAMDAMAAGAATPAAAGQVMAVAATVVLLRDGPEGPEVLLLERPRDRGSFAGAWVFPGGVVDPEDLLADGAAGAAHPAEPDEERVARRAAVREVREETALNVPLDSLVVVACWTPPEGVPKRLRAWFYYAPAPAAEVTLAPAESIDYAWIRPAEALGRHAAGQLSLVPPTWVMLHGLAQYRSVEEALDHARRSSPQTYASRVSASGRGGVLLWEGDIAYANDALVDREGGRHRLEMGELPWRYSRSPGAAEG